MNSFLTPLVEDLQKTDGSSLLVRAALICSTAGRKVCGFVGHGAVKGCTKCLLIFSTKSFSEKADYSDFDKSHWTGTQRSFQEHRRVDVQCKTRSAQKSIERDFGVRYSILLELPYFDPVQFCVVDPPI